MVEVVYAGNNHHYSCSLSIFPVQAHNALFAAGAQSYFLRVNQFADRTMGEIRNTTTGLGLFSSDQASLAPSQMTRGQLPVNYNSPRTIDTEQGCRTAVTEEQQQSQFFNIGLHGSFKLYSDAKMISPKTTLS